MWETPFKVYLAHFSPILDVASWLGLRYDKIGKLIEHNVSSNTECSVVKMISKLRIKLFVVLLAFAVVVTFTVATVDHLRLKQQTIKDNEFKVEQATETVKYALKTIDKAYFFLDEETTT